MDLLIYILAAVLLAIAFFAFAKKKQTRRFGIILIATAVLLELFVFNFHSFHLVGGGYEKTELELSGAVAKGFNTETEDIISNKSGQEASLEFNGIDKKIGTVKIEFDYLEGDAEGRESSYVDVRIDASDVTNSADFRYNVASGRIIKGDADSEYIILDLSGEVSDLRLKLSTEHGSAFKVTSVTLNSPKPFAFSVWRLLIIVGIAIALYALCNFPALKKEYFEQKHLFERIAVVMTGVFAVLAVILTFLSASLSEFSFKLTGGNQITQELVDAFKAGQVHLLELPSEELLALENPYDWSLRQEAGVSYKWDHLLFDGKYYSYYGIAPVLLLFLPYNLITGYYFPTPTAVMLFGIVGIIFLSLLFIEIIKRFFEKLPINIAICSLVLLQLCSGIWYCFCSPLFYEIAQASGFMFTMMGFYFLIRSGVIGGGKISRISLCASSFCLAMAVLCRPTLALYCVAALIFIGIGFFKNRKIALAENKSVVKSSVTYLASALICFAVIGGIQMIYNYMRFGSILDFGIQYSLTINDFTRAQYHTDFVAIGFWNYLFAFPQVRPEFPFVFSNFSTLGVNGYYFIANVNAIGLLWRALPMFGYFGAAAAYKKLDKKHRLPALLVILSTCVIAPFIIIFSIWESGYGVRYSADFAVELILGGMMIIYFLCLCQKDGKREIFMDMAKKFFVISLFVAFIANFALIYDYMSKDGELLASFLSFERIFEFWR